MQYDFVIILLLGIELVAYSQPPMTFIAFRKIDGSHGIRIRKEKPVGMCLPADTLFHQLHFVGQHFFQTGLRHISAVFLDAVYRVAEILIISTHSLRYGTGSPSGPKKIPGGFLSCAYFGKGTVDIGI